MNVCPNCDYHRRIRAAEYCALLLDEGTMEEVEVDLRSTDPLGFPEYPARLKKATANAGDTDALLACTGTLDVAPGEPRRHGLRVHGRLDGIRRRREDRAPRPAVARAEVSAHHRLGVGRRAHAGRRAVAHADGEGRRRARAARRASHSVHLDPHESDDRRRERQLRDARRRDPRRAGRGDRLRRTARDQADARTGPAGGIPDVGVPARPRHARLASCTGGISSARSANCCATCPAARRRRGGRRPDRASAVRGNPTATHRLPRRARLSVRAHHRRVQVRPRAHDGAARRARQSRSARIRRSTSPARTGREAASRRWRRCSRAQGTAASRRYTSPHLVDFRERMVVGGEPIPADDVVDFITRRTCR